MMRRGDAADDRLGGAARFHIAALVGKADDAVAVGHINPFGVGPERVECDAERLMQPACEDLIHRGLNAARPVRTEADQANGESPGNLGMTPSGLVAPCALAVVERVTGGRS